MEFEVLINNTFMDVFPTATLKNTHNKNILSLINDFEDGSWRYKKFQEFIWNNIAETALSQAERSYLIDKQQTTLNRAAQNLRLSDDPKSIGEGSELAEIVLYGIMKHHYSALPIVPKIFYKQNVQDYAKGADSVHITIEGNDFSLWFGEAKFYNDIKDTRLAKIITSVGNSLNTKKLRKENSIITNINDLDKFVSDKALCQRIKDSLSNQVSIDKIKTKINIPILLLHSCDITQKSNELTEAYKEEIIKFHKERAYSYFKKQLDTLPQEIHKYSEIKFHLILFPVPQKEPIINKFLANVKHFKDQ